MNFVHRARSAWLNTLVAAARLHTKPCMPQGGRGLSTNGYWVWSMHGGNGCCKVTASIMYGREHE